MPPRGTMSPVLPSPMRMPARDAADRYVAQASVSAAVSPHFTAAHPEFMPDVSLELLERNDAAIHRGLELLERRRARPSWYLQNQLYPAIDRTSERVVSDPAKWGLHDNVMRHPLMPCIITPMTFAEGVSKFKLSISNTSGQGLVFDRAPLITSLNAVATYAQLYEDAGICGVPITQGYIGAQVVGRGDPGQPVSNNYKPRPVSLTVQPPWRQPKYILNGRGHVDQTVEEMHDITLALTDPPKLGDVERGKYLMQKMMELSNNNSYIIVVWELRLDVLLRCIRQIPVRSASVAANVQRDVFERVAGPEALAIVDNLRRHVSVIESYAKMRIARNLDAGFEMVEHGILSLADFRVLSTNDILTEFEAMHIDAAPATMAGFCHVVTHTGESPIRSEERDEIVLLRKHLVDQKQRESSEIKRYRKTNSRGPTPSSSRATTGYNTPSAAAHRTFAPASTSPTEMWQPAQRTAANQHADAVGQLLSDQ
jgi:hypothetical protein